jgi:hypothetical protein
MKKALFVVSFLWLFLYPSWLSAQISFDTLMKEYAPLIDKDDIANNELIEQYSDLDFSPLWKEWIGNEYIGYIGDNYERLRLKVCAISRDTTSPAKYSLTGHMLWNGEVSAFQGYLEIKSIKKLAVPHWGVDDAYKGKGIQSQGAVFGDFVFNLETGDFEGIFSALWLLDKNGKIKYDQIEKFSDSFRNNQFIALWKNSIEKQPYKSAWGDYRIPASNDLDIGAGEFSPNPKYSRYGWKSYIENLKQGEDEADFMQCYPVKNPNE